MKKLTFFKRFELGLILFAVLLRYMEKKGYLFYFCRYIPYPNILYWLLLIIVLLALFYILPKSDAKIRYYLLTIFLALCGFIYLFFNFMNAEKPVMTMKKSPDKVHEIVFLEYDSEYENPIVYERIYFFVLKKIGKPIISSRSYPIHDGKYIIDWNSTGFTLRNIDPGFSNEFKNLTVPFATSKDGELINR